VQEGKKNRGGKEKGNKKAEEKGGGRGSPESNYGRALTSSSHEEPMQSDAEEADTTGKGRRKTKERRDGSKRRSRIKRTEVEREERSLQNFAKGTQPQYVERGRRTT